MGTKTSRLHKIAKKKGNLIWLQKFSKNEKYVNNVVKLKKKTVQIHEWSAEYSQNCEKNILLLSMSNRWRELFSCYSPEILFLEGSLNSITQNKGTSYFSYEVNNSKMVHKISIRHFFETLHNEINFKIPLKTWMRFFFISILNEYFYFIIEIE